MLNNGMIFVISSYKRYAKYKRRAKAMEKLLILGVALLIATIPLIFVAK